MSLNQGSLFRKQEQTANARIQPYSKKELCLLYGISHKVLALWLKPLAADIGALKGRYFTAAQVKIIFQQLGLPGYPDSS